VRAQSLFLLLLGGNKKHVVPGTAGRQFTTRRKVSLRRMPAQDIGQSWGSLLVETQTWGLWGSAQTRPKASPTCGLFTHRANTFPFVCSVLNFLVLNNLSLIRSYKNSTAGCWWLTPVILATEEAEIRRIAVWNQPKQIVQETQSQKNPSQKRAGRVVQGVGPEFKPQYLQNPPPQPTKSIEMEYTLYLAFPNDSILHNHKEYIT
jgi:hypothetical protein